MKGYSLRHASIVKNGILRVQKNITFKVILVSLLLPLKEIIKIKRFILIA